jgi:LemA protein
MGNNVAGELGMHPQLALPPPSSHGLRRHLLLVRTVVRVGLVIILILELSSIWTFCRFVVLQQDIFAQGSRIEVEYQRRQNLLLQLSELAKAYAQHETDLMNYVSDARALAKSSQKLRSVLGPAKGAQVEKVFSKLIALAEHYPTIKADRSYAALLAKTATTENRIAKAREEYAALMNKYNLAVQTFPNVAFAEAFGFTPMDVYMPEIDPMPAKDSRFFFIY